MGVTVLRTYPFVAQPAIKSEAMARAIVVDTLALLILRFPHFSVLDQPDTIRHDPCVSIRWSQQETVARHRPYWNRAGVACKVFVNNRLQRRNRRQSSNAIVLVRVFFTHTSRPDTPFGGTNACPSPWKPIMTRRIFTRRVVGAFSWAGISALES